MERIPAKFRPRPVTPPDLLNGSSKEEKEKFAKEVLQQVIEMERNRSIVSGFGSPWITDADKGKETPIFTQDHSNYRNIQSARQAEEQNGLVSNQWVGPAGPSSSYLLDGIRDNGESTSRSAPGNFSTLSALKIPTEKYYRGAPPKSEAEVIEYAMNTFITSTKFQEDIRNSQQHAASNASQRSEPFSDSLRRRLEKRPRETSFLRKLAADFTRKNLHEVEAALSKEKLKALTLAYYCKPGLKYTSSPEIEKLQQKLSEINESQPQKLEKLGCQIRLSKEFTCNTPEMKNMAVAIEHKNKTVSQQDYKNGVVRMSPHIAAGIVSAPSPSPWRATSAWAMDYEKGEWIRLDQYGYHNHMANPKGKYSCYVSEGSQRTRTLVNQVTELAQMKLTCGHVGLDCTHSQDLWEQITFPSQIIYRRGDRMSSSSAPSRLGGGFGLVSGVATADPNQPRPSRPFYKNGLFLFPFASEEERHLASAPASDAPPQFRDASVPVPSRRAKSSA